MKVDSRTLFKSITCFVVMVFVLSLTSCSVPKFALRSNAEIETLSICAGYSNEVPPQVQATFDSTIAVFVNEFNAEQHLFNLGPCYNDRRCGLNIDIKETHLVSKQKQWSSTLITVLGLSLPVVMLAAEASFVVFFYSFPNDVSIIDLSLTSDIAPRGSMLNRNISNSGYLMSEKRQIKKHGIAFHSFLNRELFWIEKEYKKQQKAKQKFESKRSNRQPMIIN